VVAAKQAERWRPSPQPREDPDAPTRRLKPVQEN
jgi:hypothetical protein